LEIMKTKFSSLSIFPGFKILHINSLWF
jgi:hypothetical protein